MYYNRRTIVKPKKAIEIVPFDSDGKLNKGFRYAGDGKITDKTGNEYLISDYK